jgi:hypothetical protein
VGPQVLEASKAIGKAYGILWQNYMDAGVPHGETREGMLEFTRSTKCSGESLRRIRNRVIGRRPLAICGKGFETSPGRTLTASHRGAVRRCGLKNCSLRTD